MGVGDPPPVVPIVKPSRREAECDRERPVPAPGAKSPLPIVNFSRPFNKGARRSFRVVTGS
ncbi:hypothetical protein ABH920_009348 [Catenulispora sp. EB89]